MYSCNKHCTVIANRHDQHPGVEKSMEGGPEKTTGARTRTLLSSASELYLGFEHSGVALLFAVSDKQRQDVPLALKLLLIHQAAALDD